jgi:dihydroorotate dehydrogenase electron transfer subunit
MNAAHPSHRGSILVEDARVLKHTTWPDGQHVLVLESPRIAAKSTPGAFVHLTCDANLPMRRPLSLQRADAAKGTIEILYKVVGEGTRRLSKAGVGDTLSCMGPIGNGFLVDRARPIPLLIGGGVGLPPMVFLAEALSRDSNFKPLVLLGSEIPFPFETVMSAHALPGIPESANHSHPDLESIGIASRLASLSGLTGCYKGYVTELAAEWILSLDTETRSKIAIYACGPTPMLAATARLARRFSLPAQVSLEEYMACAVGGCAGCAVPVSTPEGMYMKRVCVDGPVFDAYQVFPEA